jgi:hypothetical protein
MGDREMSRMHKYGESKTTRITMATVPHVTDWAGRTKYQAAWFLLNRVYQHADIAQDFGTVCQIKYSPSFWVSRVIHCESYVWAFLACLFDVPDDHFCSE